MIRVVFVTLFLWCFTITCFAWQGWIYSMQGAAYYSISDSENTPFSWSGGVLGQKVHGYGVQQFYAKDGRKLGRYEGNMIEGYRQGHGVLSWNAYQYNGEWYQSSYNGKGHLRTAATQHLGIFKNGKAHGRGVRVSDGFLETGDFENDRFLGTVANPGYFVIGFCSTDREQVIAEAEKHRQLGLKPIVIYSSEWDNLAPGVYVVVYGVLSDHEEIRLLGGFSFFMEIPYYIKYSGAYRG